MIGLWIARFTDAGTQLTKWHLCETEIEDRKITRCGRALRPIEGTVVTAGLLMTFDPVCKRCGPAPTHEPV